MIQTQESGCLTILTSGLMGDAGVGKSVMAGALAQRAKKAGHLGAAYFCRHTDGTRNGPRHLLGTVACQLCYCNSEYNSLVGGEDRSSGTIYKTIRKTVR